MTELGFKEDFKCALLHIDNARALHVTRNQAYSSRAKDVASRYFCTHEIIRKLHVSIHYTPTKKELRTDLGTKFPTKQRHWFLIDIIKNIQTQINWGPQHQRHRHRKGISGYIARRGSS